MQLFTLGLNHHTAPLAIRERVAFHAERLRSALAELTLREPVREAAILSTCNRTELYCALGEPQAALEWLAGYHRVQPQELKPYLYTLPQGDAVRHAFRVAESAGTLGTLLNKLFQRSFAVAKELRSNTGIGANVVSMAAAAVKLAGRIFPSLAEQKVLLIGAGEMIELAATHFAAQQPRGMAVASRTLERAESLARRFNAESIELRDLPERLPEYDIIISCTASSLPIIGKGTMERTVRARRHRPVFMVDLAVPRDIEAEVAAMDDVFLYTIDDLAATVREGIDARQSAVAQAEVIIESQVGSFLHWMKTREMVPLIRQLRETAEDARRHEVERAERMLARGDDPKTVLEALSHGLTNKLMHAPTETLNQSGEGDESLKALVARLYRLRAGD